MKNLSLLTALATLGLMSTPALAEPAAPTAEATVEAKPPPASEARSRLVFSAQGPGAGNHALGSYLSIFAVVPMADFRWAYGITDALSFHLRGASWWGLGFSRSDVGLRYAWIRSSAFSLATELSASGMVAFLPGQEAGAGAGFNPKLLFSFGSDELQVTFGTEVMVWPANSATEVDPLMWVEANIAVEVAAVDGASFAIQAGAAIFNPSNGSAVPAVPTLSIGGSI